MKFLDKIKDLFSDEEEVIETKEIELEEPEEEQDHKLPTFMRNKIEEEQKREEERRKKEEVVKEEVVSDREIVKTRSNSNFAFPIEMDDTDQNPTYNYDNQNVLTRERKASIPYSKREEPKPKKFRPTPVISPVYGILDKNYTKDDVKVQDENAYEIQRPSRKIDFETVRNKAFGSLTDDIRNNLCENCELYQEVKITKATDIKTTVKAKPENNLLSDMTGDESLGDAEENYFDFGVNYEVPKEVASPKREEKKEELSEIKIINHNEEESTAEKIEVHETSEDENKAAEDTKKLKEMLSNEENADSILESLDDLNNDNQDANNDIFNLIDSVYDEEEK